ncbi:hypothetical protein EVAR_44398_1 [Eumeta japonica]|uniref:Uncharacterized protein n=1 Tax=Eumeta variegata TaxID=151549 RepID=A0A4C1XRS2_EUMVA|nr:hypothetical protein EVAR_44398_1 [Eumeta japonica]
MGASTARKERVYAKFQVNWTCGFGDLVMSQPVSQWYLVQLKELTRLIDWAALFSFAVRTSQINILSFKQSSSFVILSEREINDAYTHPGAGDAGASREIVPVTRATSGSAPRNRSRVTLRLSHLKGVTLGNVTMSHRTRRGRRMPASLSHSTMIGLPRAALEN